MKQKNIYIIIIVIFILLAIMIIFKYSGINGGPKFLTNNGEKCNYNKTINISKKLKQEYLNDLKNTNKYISSYTGTTNDKLFLYYIKQSRLNQYLGNYCKAISSINTMKKTYKNSSFIPYNNLGSIYDELGQYTKAIIEYKYIIDNKLVKNKSEYFRKITVDYINLKDRRNAAYSYVSYEKTGGKRDKDLMNKIKQIKLSKTK